MSVTSMPAHQHGDGAADVAGLQPYRAALARSTVTSTCGISTWYSAWRSMRPSMPVSGVLHVIRRAPQGRQLRPEDAHDDRLARARQDLLDALPEVGLNVAIKPRIAVDGLLDGLQRRLVVDVGVDADPVLGEVDAVGLVAADRAPDMRAEVAHAGDLAQLAAGLLGDAVGLRMRGARRRHPVHQEVALLERGQQRLSEERPGGGSGNGDRRGERSRAAPG